MNRIASLLVVMLMVSFFMTGCGPKKTREQLYAEANKYKQEEKYKEAINAFLELVKFYPKSASADSMLFEVGQIYSNNLADFQSAVDMHQRLIKEYPDSRIRAQALFLIGYHYANSIHDLDKARDSYQQFLEKYPHHELCSSVKWELDHLGQDINEIDFLKTESTDSANNTITNSNPKGIK